MKQAVSQTCMGSKTSPRIAKVFPEVLGMGDDKDTVRERVSLLSFRILDLFLWAEHWVGFSSRELQICPNIGLAARLENS